MEERTVVFRSFRSCSEYRSDSYLRCLWMDQRSIWLACLIFHPGITDLQHILLGHHLWIRDFPAEDDEESVEVNHKNKLPKNKKGGTETSKKIALPIKAILLNPAVASCALFKFAGRWSVLLIASKVPTYLKVILHQDLSSNGYTNALIFSLMAVSMTVTGALSDQVINRGILSRTRCRKAFSLFSGFGVALTLMLIPAAGCCPYKLHSGSLPQLNLLWFHGWIGCFSSI